MKKVVVIGSGVAGLASAVLLKKQGFDVKVFEMNSSPGGKINSFAKDGFRFDTGASLITMPFVIYDFFEDIDEDVNQYVELVKLPVSCKYFWKNGVVFNAYNSKDELRKELVNVFGIDEYNSFVKYLNDNKSYYNIAFKSFMSQEFRIANFIGYDGLINSHYFMSGQKYSSYLRKYFKNKNLIQVFERFATYNGSSPYLTPKLFSVIPFVEFEFGAWYVKGGIYKLILALIKLCRKYDIPINYNRKFISFESKDKVISKLRFRESGSAGYEIDDFDYVVSNFTNSKKLAGTKYIQNTDWSMSGFIMMMGVEGRTDALEHHNILFSENYFKEFKNIVDEKIPADDMTIYISVTKKSTEEDAPENCENWFLLVNAPFLSDNFKWTNHNIDLYKNRILDRVEEFGFKIKNRIRFTEIITPEDFLKRYNSEFGSLYGLSSNSNSLLYKRPKNKSKLYKNLYFVGGNSHPGGGIPLCFLSAKIISKLFLKNLYGKNSNR
jgi:phytoene desaturase